MLQGCFQDTDWDLFAKGSDLEEHACSVLGYINFCTESVTTQRTIKGFLNQQLWMNSKVRTLLKEWDAAFRLGDQQAYSAAWRELKRGIREAKRRHKQRMEEKFNNNNPCNLSKGIKLTDYKTKNHHLMIPTYLMC